MHHGRAYKKTPTEAAIDVVFTDSVAETVKKPHRLPVLQLYQREHYQTRIKPEFIKAWATLSQERLIQEACGEEISTEATAMMSLRYRVSKRLWNLESEEFRLEMTKRVEEDLELQKELIQQALAAPKDPQEYLR